MEQEIKKDIEKVLKEIELLKKYKNKFDTLKMEAWHDNINIFLNACHLVDNQFESEKKSLRLKLCILRGE
jgi:hypothetical protein